MSHLIRSAALIAIPAILLSAQEVKRGRSEPNFSQPSLPPGVDYVLPNETDIKATLDRIREHFVRSTTYQIINYETGEPIKDFTKPVAAAGLERKTAPFNEWEYSMGVVLAGMLQITDVTGDAKFQDYALKNFDFIFDHLDYFRAQAKEFGGQRGSYRRMLNMRELDDCGAMGAALVKAYARRQEPKYRVGIDMVTEHIMTKQKRLADGTLARPRPQPTSVWIDDAYMSIPFLAQMGKMTGDKKYFDDGAQQVIGMAARLMDPVTNLWDHSWFENTPNNARFYWGRGSGWMMMSMAELLSVMPENHPQRARVLDIFQRSAQALTAVQSGNGMWHQLLDKTDSYLETSGTAMNTFAIARGVNKGWLPVTYAPVAQTGWMALATQVQPDGRIDKICVSTTAAYDAVYYYNRPTDLNAMQGYGATLMAGAEVISMLRNFRVDRNLNTFHYRVKQ